MFCTLFCNFVVRNWVTPIGMAAWRNQFQNQSEVLKLFVRSLRTICTNRPDNQCGRLVLKQNRLDRTLKQAKKVFVFSFFRNFALIRERSYFVSANKRINSFVLLSTFCSIALIRARSYFVSAKKRINSFVLLSTFRNFVRICRISLNKGSLGDWGKSGLRIGNRTQFHILLWIAFNEHLMLSLQPFMTHHRVQR